MTRPTVELRGLHKLFPGVRALADVSFTMRAGSIHALVGENGAGKSTLINILSGTLQPDAGAIVLEGKPVTLTDARSARRHGIVTVHQEVDLFADLSVAENLGHEQGLPTNALGGVRWDVLRAQTQAAFEAIGVAIAPSVPAGRLTAAQRQLVEIAAAISQQARVLILDEPTSSLSGAETHILVQQLRRFRAQGTAILYVSHRLEEIFALADEVTVLRNGRHVATEAIRDTSPARLVRLMVGQRGDVDEGGASPEPLEKSLLQREPGRVRLACHQLSAADGSFADVNLEVRAGEILGLYGLVGAGRSEWAQAVFGLRRVGKGTVTVDGEAVTPDGSAPMIGRGVAYLPEDRLRQGLCRGLSVRANMVLASLRRLGPWLWVPRSRETRQTRAAVDRLGVRLRDIDQPVGTLSGGNQQKVVLGRWLGCEPGVLLLDEPTRGVDVGAKREIHGLVHGLARAGKAVVLISSDLPEVLSQSDRVGVFREGRLVEVFTARDVQAADVTAAAIPASKHGEASVRLSNDRADRPRMKTSRLATLFGWLRQGGLLTVVLLLLAFQPGSWIAIAQDTALLGFCALAAAVVIIAGGIDISIGALMALSTGLAGQLWEHGHPWPIVVGAGVAVGLVGSVLNAGLSLLGRVHPIVITLGTMSVFRGLTLWQVRVDVQVPLTTRAPLYAAIPWAGLTAAVVLAGFLGYTVWGRRLYAFGSNPAAAHRVGIHQGRVWLLAFGLQGVLIGLAGVLYLAASGSMQPTAFEDVPLQAIAAAVVGGVAITGGRGGVPGVVLGCLFLTVLPGFCLALHIPTVWQQTLVGSIIAIAVTTDVLLRRGES